MTLETMRRALRNTNNPAPPSWITTSHYAVVGTTVKRRLGGYYGDGFVGPGLSGAALEALRQMAKACRRWKEMGLRPMFQERVWTCLTRLNQMGGASRKYSSEPQPV